MRERYAILIYVLTERNKMMRIKKKSIASQNQMCYTD